MYLETREGLQSLELLSHKERLNNVRVSGFFRVINSEAMRQLNPEQVITGPYNSNIRVEIMNYQTASSIYIKKKYFFLSELWNSFSQYYSCLNDNNSIDCTNQEFIPQIFHLEI